MTPSRHATDSLRDWLENPGKPCPRFAIVEFFEAITGEAMCPVPTMTIGYDDANANYRRYRERIERLEAPA